MYSFRKCNESFSYSKYRMLPSLFGVSYTFTGVDCTVFLLARVAINNSGTMRTRVDERKGRTPCQPRRARHYPRRRTASAHPYTSQHYPSPTLFPTSCLAQQHPSRADHVNVEHPASRCRVCTTGHVSALTAVQPAKVSDPRSRETMKGSHIRARVERVHLNIRQAGGIPQAELAVRHSAKLPHVSFFDLCEASE